ncbi:uncharacterized protein LOC131635440 [Vicia villosa]|uniref:uncharacterized protein LOC131635440 n=1 Tax=Vicia villosa TaxID=3911 RepID=UPI00273B6F38|nr:uncharacterized protein LOC131635440 [Vicia villosa]
MNSVKKLESESTELPDCIISHIFSKLSLKTLVKTSALSKQWYHEWGLRKDLNFDLHNMFDHYNIIPELPKTLSLLREAQSQFATRLDNFMLKYHGDMIRSIRVNFPLGHDHTDVIDRLLHKGLLKGVNRIEFLFAYKTHDDDDIDLEIIKPYNFSFPFLSNNNSVTYLHLQNCHIAQHIEFSELKNLTTLVLHLIPLRSDLKVISSTLLHLNIKCGDIVSSPWNIDISASNLSSFEYHSKSKYFGLSHRVKIKSHKLSKFSSIASKISKFVDFSKMENLTTIVLDGLHECVQTKVMPHLLSKCLQLEDIIFKNCRFTCDLKIISAKLRHLTIINCCHKNLDFYKIDIDALNLSSFEYRDYRSLITVEAPKLLKVFWDEGFREKKYIYNFTTIARLHQVEDLAMHMTLPLISKLTEDLVQFQNLRRLKLFIEGVYDPNMDYFWILDIVMASQRLQKLSVTIQNAHEKKSHMIGSHRQRREYAGFFHNDLKYVQLHGCVCSTNIIELASHLLRSAKSLKQITFSCRDNFYIGDGRWTEGSNGCCWFERNLIHEMLKDEVKEQCQLIIL